MNFVWQFARARLGPVLANDYAKNVGILAFGTVAAQLVMFLVLPLLTRLFDPQAFGVLAVFSAILLTLSVAICFRLELAIPLPMSDQDAMALVVLSLIATLLGSAFMGFIVHFFGHGIAVALNSPEVQAYLWLVPLGLLVSGLYSVVQMWAIRQGRMREVAFTQFTRAFGGAATQVGLGLAGWVPHGLIYGYLVYIGLGSPGLLKSLFSKDGATLKNLRWSDLRRNLREHWRFPVFSVPESLLDAAAVYAPLLVIAAYGGVAEAGFLMLAQRITGAPVAILAGNMSRVFLSQAREKQREGLLGKFTRDIMLIITQWAIVPFALLMFLAPLCFHYVFGAEWNRAGVIVAWTVPYAFLQLIVSPVSSVLHVQKRQFQVFLLKLFGVCLVVGSTLLAGETGFYPVIETFAISSLIYYALYGFTVHYYSARG